MKQHVIDNIKHINSILQQVKNFIDIHPLGGLCINAEIRSAFQSLEVVEKYIEKPCEKDPIKFSSEQKMLLMTCVFDHIVEKVESDQFEFWFNMVKKVCEL